MKKMLINSISSYNVFYPMKDKSFEKHLVQCLQMLSGWPSLNFVFFYRVLGSKLPVYDSISLNDEIDLFVRKGKVLMCI